MILLQVWDGVSDARIEFSAAELGLQVEHSGMSRLTENFNLQRALLRHLDSILEVNLLQQTKVVSITNDLEERGGWPLVHLDNSKTIRARLLVRQKRYFIVNLLAYMLPRLAPMASILPFGRLQKYHRMVGHTILKQL